MSDYWHCAAICPFYLGTSKKRIFCENDTVLIFPDKESAQEYLKNHCGTFEGYVSCSYAEALLNYYARIDSDNKKDIQASAPID